ncbi:TPA: hypothetical protein ACTUT5_002887 [Legionella anisa]|uniref:hypothetical protein n=1 Tax=Legionella anisa TaxID=28082 RepID=UPI00034A0319|nr:hypothetical protein [Legionella anisa]MBN5937079.1 hypothetical protein [Legionella anisa]UAK80089.1 hypothetical protein K8O89_03130 [Legionella anisa]
MTEERNKYKDQNPHYIPGKTPKSLSQLLQPAQRNLADACLIHPFDAWFNSLYNPI